MYQVWGVTEQYFKEHVFPDASDSTLSALGSMSGMVSGANVAAVHSADAADIVHDNVECYSRKTRGSLVSASGFCISVRARADIHASGYKVRAGSARPPRSVHDVFAAVSGSRRDPLDNQHACVCVLDAAVAFLLDHGASDLSLAK